MPHPCPLGLISCFHSHPCPLGLISCFHFSAHISFWSSFEWYAASSWKIRAGFWWSRWLGSRLITYRWWWGMSWFKFLQLAQIKFLCSTTSLQSWPSTGVNFLCECWFNPSWCSQGAKVHSDMDDGHQIQIVLSLTQLFYASQIKWHNYHKASLPTSLCYLCWDWWSSLHKRRCPSHLVVFFSVSEAANYSHITFPEWPVPAVLTYQGWFF